MDHNLLKCGAAFVVRTKPHAGDQVPGDEINSVMHIIRRGKPLKSNYHHGNPAPPSTLSRNARIINANANVHPSPLNISRLV